MDTAASSLTKRPTVLITGAAIGGIGAALVKSFCSKGCYVFACVRSEASVDALRAQTAGSDDSIDIVQLDVTCVADIRRARDYVSAQTSGTLDILINNAGKAIPMPATDLDIDGAVKSMFEVNLFGAMRMVQEFAKLLITAKGTIVNISSISPLFPLIYSAGYNSTKAALTAYGDTLRVEMKPFEVNVITIMSGIVKSNIIRTDVAPLPEDSLYYPALDGWHARTSREGPLSNGTPTCEFAESLAKQILKPHNKQPLWVWEGKYSTVAWCLAYVLPKGFYDMPQIKRYGLKNLRDIWLGKWNTGTGA